MAVVMRTRASKTGGGVPQQAAAFPSRRTDGILEVCLIRRRDATGWGIPKGNIDRGNTPEATALIEAYEEAGVEGRLLDRPVGTYRYEKWEVSLLVVVYVMQVLEEHADWEEARIRERKWIPFDQAASLLMNHPIRPLLEAATSLAADYVS